MKEINVQMITLEQVNIIETVPQKESDSNFTDADYRHLAARKHEGDENGNTWCKFASLQIPLESEALGLTDVVIGDSRTVSVKESESNVQCEHGEIIVARKHHGDENGTTEYTIAQVYARINTTKILIPCVAINPEEKTCKESDGSYMEIAGKCMVGRRHNGDENKNTTYTFAHIAVPYVSVMR